jgi:hypothetical protein
MKDAYDLLFAHVWNMTGFILYNFYFDSACSYYDEANTPRFSIIGESLAPFKLVIFS